MEVVFETHATSEDNERGVASGWGGGPLSALGREQARALGARRGGEALAAVFTSDLARATETVSIAFGRSVDVFVDWRLRECDYGRLTGRPAADVHGARARFLEEPHPGGESWREAVERVGRALRDVVRFAAGRRVLVVGHIATRWGCEHFFRGAPLEDLATERFTWQPGWSYRVEGAPPAS